MVHITRGIVIIMGIMLIFMVATACSSGKAFTKSGVLNEENSDFEKEEFTYNEQSEAEDRGYITRRSQYRNRDRENQKDYSNDESSNANYYQEETVDKKPERAQYYQKGNASWYGREFHGRKTASGERFNMNKMTAAHKKLPFGTYLLVTNLENGKSVRVIVNDRGPYRDERILDLSFAAAKKLNFISRGNALVGIKVLRKGSEEQYSNNDNRYYDDDTIEPVSGIRRHTENEYSPDNEIFENNDNSYYSIQAGAFYSRKNAERLQRRLEGFVGNPVLVINKGDMFKVRIEEIKSRREASRIKRMLKDENISTFILYN